MNLYVHFPFCRRKCTYCALYSVAGRNSEFRNQYAKSISDAISLIPYKFKTIYFGGGTPSLCDLRPVFNAIQEKLGDGYEWTIEVNPLDVSLERMKEFYSSGVNRISMGVQSLDDETLLAMQRGHTADEALAAFKTLREAGFTNAGIDIIAGYPSVREGAWEETLEKLASFSLDHCSVYSLIRESGTLLDKQVTSGKISLPNDDKALDELIKAQEALSAMGLFRYEISSYAKKGFECKHNLATWNGEDYIGLGAGAHGRVGRLRSVGSFENISPLINSNQADKNSCSELGEEEDALERVLFRLRTREGLNFDVIRKDFPIIFSREGVWKTTLSRFEKEGLITSSNNTFTLSNRGMEVCDSILSELL